MKGNGTEGWDFFGNKVPEKSFGNIYSEAIASRCYVKITITSEDFTEARRTEVSPGKCSLEVEASIKVHFECVCEAPSDATTKFSWTSITHGANCRPIGSSFANYGFFKIILYTPAAGSCPPGTCVGKAPPFYRTYKDTMEVGCGGTVCDAVNGARMQKQITRRLEAQLRSAYGGKTIKCPKEDDEFLAFDNMPSVFPRSPKV